MSYLSENPTNYIDLRAVEEFEEKLAYQQSQQQQLAAPLPAIDLALGDELLSLALDADFTQNSLMDTVARQGEQIDRIGNTLDRIDAKLDRADHLLRGIESYRYYFFGKQKKTKAREDQLEKRSMERPPNTPPPIEVEILIKKADALSPAILALDTDEFRITDATSNILLESHKFAAIDAMVMVVKPEHMHFMIKGATKGPIVIISSYLQVIVNQIHSRSKKINQHPKVVFHTPGRKFEYQDDRVSAVAAATHTPMADLLADPTAKQQANQLESTLDQVLEITQGLNQKGRKLNEELSRQNQVLANHNNRVDGMIDHSRNINGRLDYQNKKYG